MAEHRLDRRGLLRGVAAAAIGVAGDGLTRGVLAPAVLRAQPLPRATPFTLGVASGDPAPDGFVIWTRLAPSPFDGGGMPDRPVEVGYEIAHDAAFAHIVRTGREVARPQAAHSVHVEVAGLAPGRDYFYRFAAAGARSPVGRVRTLPATGSTLAQLRFAAVGCQRWEHGYYTAYRHLAAEDLDFAFHYGDYIYEYAQITEAAPDKPAVVRRMPRDYGIARTLADYRNRYAVYKSDPDLQAAHAAMAFVVSFDDHEVANNWSGQFAGGGLTPNPTAAFLRRRAAAFQAWYEHSPVRRASRPRGPSVQAYRAFAVGDLATLFVLDTRQYRSSQPCGDGWKQCPEARNPARGLLGRAQERWLYDSLGRSRTRWNVLAQQVLMMQMDRAGSADARELHMDRWDGASAGRDRLFDAIVAAKVPGVVTLTGDIHNNWAGDLKRDFAAARSPTLGVEFVATSISSGGDGADSRTSIGRLLARNPHIKFFNNQRGYVRHTVTRARWQADFRVLDKVSVAGRPISTRKTFITLRAEPGLKAE